jgi:uncharacterized membrane protein YecN with MAPEG domain
MPAITALYAGILGLISLALAFAVGRIRGATGISLGDGGNPELLVAIRRHGNFVEYVPLAVVLIAFVELDGASAAAVHALGGGLVVARIAHAIGLKADTIQHPGRAIGAGLTVLITAVASIWSISTFF